MVFNHRKNALFALLLLIASSTSLFCSSEEIIVIAQATVEADLHVAETPLVKEIIIVGGGMIGGMEAYFAWLEAKEHNIPVRITIYDKNNSLAETTISNIVPSLTPDEILSVIPRGPELVKKMKILFSEPGGIRVEDVADVHESASTEHFTQEVQAYSLDEEGHKQRTQALLELGKMSMDLWQEIYQNADDEFKEILRLSNFNRCGEPSSKTKKLHDGYRIDLIYNIANAAERANGMKADYVALGYKQCTILSPDEVMAIDPFLTDFCMAHSKNNVWDNDAVALWRPGGCLDGQVFLPKLYEYLKKVMGTYTNAQGKQEDCFQIKFGKKVVGVEYAQIDGNMVVSGLTFEDGNAVTTECGCTDYVFCPGEAVGTLKQLGFAEPAYAGFAGASLMLDIEIPKKKIKKYKKFSHCMEVHQEGVVLAWQARFRDNKIFIGGAGTKAYYGDQRPTKDQAFAKNRNLLQLNMMNDVLPEFLSLALGYDTKGKVLTEKDLDYLEAHNIAKRWAGVRAVVYDGFPTLGCLYHDDMKVINARATTHLGSGGGSFAPAATHVSRKAMNNETDPFINMILDYADSYRTAVQLN